MESNRPQNIQLKRFGKVVQAHRPAEPRAVIPVTVCIYFDKGDELPTSYVKSEQDLSYWVIEYNNQLYNCLKSVQSNSELFKTIIVPLDVQQQSINLDAVTI